MRRLQALTIVVLAAGLVALPIMSHSQALPKKLIEYGWDVPKPSYVAQHIREMEKRPFDGIMMYIPNVRDVFWMKELDEEVLAGEMEALKNIEWHKFTDNFITMLARSQMDWFSDADWEWVLRNVGLCARAARVGHCKGLTFDAEPYGTSPWNYSAQVHADAKSFREYERIVRKRGAQFMTRIQQELPHPVIHTFYLLALFRQIAEQPNPAKREEMLIRHSYSLYPAFINGMLDAAGPDTIITDGNESAYYYTKPQDYFESYHTIHQTSQSLIVRRLRSKYRAQVQCAQALYVDHLFGIRTNKTVANYMTEQERAQWFEHNVYYALKSSDRYVWLYSERMNWWTGKDMPPGLEEAVISARSKIRHNEALQTNIPEIIEAAQARMQAELEASLVKRSAEITRLAAGDEPPVIDGWLADDAWQTIPSLERFLKMATTRQVTAQTFPRVVYDDANLYLGISIQEPNMAGLNIVGAARDDNVWMGDSLDLFLTADPQRTTFYHFMEWGVSGGGTAGPGLLVH